MEICRGWIRVLLPFHLRDAGSLEATSRWPLSGQDAAGQDAAWFGIGKGSDSEKIAHSAYYAECLPHVQRFLFAGIGSTGCRYFKLKSDRLPLHRMERSEVWLRNLSRVEEKCQIAAQALLPSLRGLQVVGVEADDPVWKAPTPFDSPHCRLPMHVSLDESAVELWISHLGVGVLSVSLHCEPADSPESQNGSFFGGLLRLNALATAHQSVWLRPMSASATVAGGTAMHTEAHGKSSAVGNVTQRPAQHMHQFVRDLMRPLWADGHLALQFDQRGVLYSAIEVRQPERAVTDFEAELTECLSQLAQVQPPTHPGEGELRHARLLKINNRHLSAISLSGAAHASILPSAARQSPADEPVSAFGENIGADTQSEEEHQDNDPAAASQYDRQRLSRIQREYFSGFLLAQVQRLCLQRLLDESAELSTVTDDQQRRAGHEQLLEKALRFRLEGEFVQACWRPTLQAHHALAQQTCEVPEGLRTIQQAMTEFNHVATQRAAQQQRQAAERAAHQRHEETERTERTMQVLEVFIVTFYSVELAHILGESFDFGHTVFVGWSLIGVALATFFMAALLISWKWLKTKGTKWTVISLFALATTIHALFLTANAWWKAADTTTRPVVPHSSNVQQPTDEPDGHSQANPEKHK